MNVCTSSKARKLHEVYHHPLLGFAELNVRPYQIRHVNVWMADGIFDW